MRPEAREAHSWHGHEVRVPVGLDASADLIKQEYAQRQLLPVAIDILGESKRVGFYDLSQDWVVASLFNAHDGLHGNTHEALTVLYSFFRLKAEQLFFVWIALTTEKGGPLDLVHNETFTFAPFNEHLALVERQLVSAVNGFGHAD